MSGRGFHHAIVAGGSMAGLLAARVLSDHFDHVTLVERDLLPSKPEARRGVPQGRHVHVLLPRGLSIIERLFPSATAELQSAGALMLNGGRELAWHHAGGWRARYDSELALIAMTRPLLEMTVAERVRGLANVKIIEGARLAGFDQQNGHVTGARLNVNGQNSVIEADLVIDASGRGSATPQWLVEMGYAKVAKELIAAPITYSTRVFRRGDRGPDWQALIISAPAAMRTGFIFPIEGGRWLVTLSGFFDTPAPQDHEAFLSFARSLAAPDLHEAIRNLEPLSDIVRYRYTGSQRRRYEWLKSFPDGLLVIGDAVASFNPVYGQGMTVAALEAEALERVLREARRSEREGAQFARRWFRDLGKIIDVAWQGVSIEDFRFAQLAETRPASLRPLQWYMERVHRATHRSAAVTDQFYRVIGFMDPPTALFRPRILADVLFP